MSNFESMSDLAQRIAILVGFNQNGKGLHRNEVPTSVSVAVGRSFNEISDQINSANLGFQVVGYDYLDNTLLTQH